MQIVAALAPQPNDHLIEIGPGQGALTIPLLAKVDQLEVIELDRDLIPALEARARHAAGLIVHSADALEFNFAELKQDTRLLRICGNLPYNISTPLVFHLLEFTTIIADMLFMLQKEVAERLAAAADTEHYGRLSVMVQYHCQVELLFDVAPSAFFPPPQVNSSIVRLVPYQKNPYHADNYQLFADIVRAAFGQRRKTLRNSLKDIINDDDWAHMPINSNLRAENLEVKDFVAISNVVNKKG